MGVILLIILLVVLLGGIPAAPPMVNWSQYHGGGYGVPSIGIIIVLVVLALMLTGRLG